MCTCCAAGFGALLLPYHLAAARKILLRVRCLLACPLARRGRGDCLCPLLLRRLQLRPLLLLLPLVLAPLLLLLLGLRLSLEVARHRVLDVFVHRHGRHVRRAFLGRPAALSFANTSRARDTTAGWPVITKCFPARSNVARYRRRPGYCSWLSAFATAGRGGRECPRTCP